MKRFLLILFAIIAFGHVHAYAQTEHIKRCGLEELQTAMIAKDPTWTDRFKAQKAGMQAIADNYIAQKLPGAAERTSATISPIPIIFHILLDSVQLYELGGTSSIAIRCDSQIAVLNRDFNAQNPDSTMIPSSWQPLYGNTGIHFALAKVDPNGNCTPGFEIKIIQGTNIYDAGFSDIDSAFSEAKTEGTGLPAWDVTKYYNVWCLNFTGNASGLLGLTVPLSYTGAHNGWPVEWEGVCMQYKTLGCTAWDSTSLYGTGDWLVPYNLGRTLTHETGHMFEIWHPWGDDDGRCPWNQFFTSCNTGIGSDDGLSDTPPQSDWTFYNPGYSIPGGTIPDCCQFDSGKNTQPKGIACLSFLDYTDDNAVHMFTTQQAAAMAAMVLVPPEPAAGATGKGGYVGENYSLTQHPELLTCNSPIPTSITANMYPNPTTGLLTIYLSPSSALLGQIVVTNILGQQVGNVSNLNTNTYVIDLSGFGKGIYFVKCSYLTGTTIRKVLVQ